MVGRVLSAYLLLSVAARSQNKMTDVTILVPVFPEIQRDEATRRALHEEILAILRQLGAEDTASVVVWAVGRGMPLERTVEYALSHPDAPVMLSPGSPVPAGLTPREVEVLRLLAAGKSNQEIAAELVLSVRTAERHIANIYEKIGANGKTARAAATAFAFSHGLIPR
jgi:DNA-binding NarL/FixJ family response regulator